MILDLNDKVISRPGNFTFADKFPEDQYPDYPAWVSGENNDVCWARTRHRDTNWVLIIAAACGDPGWMVSLWDDGGQVPRLIGAAEYYPTDASLTTFASWIETNLDTYLVEHNL